MALTLLRALSKVKATTARNPASATTTSATIASVRVTSMSPPGLLSAPFGACFEHSRHRVELLRHAFRCGQHLCRHRDCAVERRNRRSVGGNRLRRDHDFPGVVLNGPGRAE